VIAEIPSLAELPSVASDETGSGLPTMAGQSPSVSNGMEAAASPVIFFDGECGLCNRWVDFVLARDRRREFRFAPLQGETARCRLPSSDGTLLNSVVLLDDAGEHRQSDAVARMLMRIGGRWFLPGWLLWLIPRAIRNRAYEFVARHRYQWFGQKQTCRMPSADERGRFLP
jgi:predicted DCC family thiol-disulfide oxidoreductase YuxK